MTSIVKPAPTARAPKYLAFVRQQPCCACGRQGPSHAHHQHGEPGTLKGMGLKAPDSTAVPLCVGCHNAWHSMGHFPEMTREESISRMQATRAELGGEALKRAKESGR